MDILISNDDGISAPGLRALYAALSEAGHAVCAVAPMRQRSGAGHALTVFEPLRAVTVDEAGFRGTGVHGTPADCVKLGLGMLAPRRPDMVIAGINAGPNVGPDLFYSGTVAAAAEAAMSGLPAVAVSHRRFDADMDGVLPLARHLARLLPRLDWRRLGRRVVLNINYPACPLGDAPGLRVCPPSLAFWTNAYEERRDPRGAPYWWLTGAVPPDAVEPGTDKDLLDQGYVTLSPLRFDVADHEGLRALAGMGLG